jgi:uncharacterized membrane protein YhaH (DUF805 family)
MLRLLFSFEGRVNRAKYWLVHIGVALAIAVFWLLIVGTVDFATHDPRQRLAEIRGASLLMALPMFVLFFWSGLAISVKRWHDRNKSGWWVLIGFVPVIGHLWFLIECGLLPGTPGPNTYGANPLAMR